MNLMEKVQAAIARKETAPAKVELAAGKVYKARLANNTKLRKNSYTGALEVQFSVYVSGDSTADFNGGFLSYNVEVSNLDRQLVKKTGEAVFNRNGEAVTVGDIAASRFVSLGLNSETIEAIISQSESYASTVEALGDDAWKGVKILDGTDLKEFTFRIKTAAFGKNKTIGIAEVL
jgi:hypothetical protein